MSTVVDELLIAIGVDPSDAEKGLKATMELLRSSGETASVVVSSVQETVSSSIREAAEAAGDAADSVRRAGNSAEKAGSQGEKSFGAFGDAIEKVKAGLAPLMGALSGAFALFKGFDAFISTADGLGKVARNTGLSVSELDAWGKANEAAGGSAEALFSSLQSFYQKTGRPAEEFLRLGEKIEGMSQAQARRFLEAQGVALDAIPVFLEGQKSADALVEKYRRTAFTAQDAKSAADFKTAWMDFGIAAQSVVNILARAVLPIVTRVLDFFSEMVHEIRENIRFIGIFGAGLAAAFAVKHIEAIKATAVAVKAFGVSIKGALLPVTAIAGGIAALALVIDDLMVFSKGGKSLFEETLRGAGVASKDIEDIRKALGNLGDVFGGLWDTVKPILTNFIPTAIKIIIGGLSKFIEWIAKAVAWVLRLRDNSKAAWTEIASGWKRLVTWFSDGVERIKRFFSGLWGSVTGAASGAFASAADAAESFVGAASAKAGELQDSFSNALDRTKALIEDFSKSVSKWMQKAWASFSDGLSSVGGEVSRTFDDVKGSVSSVIKSASSSVSEWADGVSGTVSDALRGVSERASKVFGPVLEGATSAVEKATETVTEWVKGLGSNVATAFSGIGDALFTAISEAFDSVGGLIASAFKSWVGDFKDIFVSPVKSTIGKIGSFFGFGGKDDEVSVGERERQAVAARHSLTSNSVTTNANLSITNNIQTNNPQQAATAVSNGLKSGWGRASDMIGQSMSGVNIKGAW